MPKCIYKILILFLTFFSVIVNAGIIENSDAFDRDDGLAIRDTDTGLVWLDFGVNNGESINSVIGNLSGLYSGWRLPTEAEVTGFWGSLAVSDLTTIFDVWGANKTPSDRVPYLAWGYFIDDEGYLGAAFIKEMPEVARSFSVSGYYEKSIIVAGMEKKLIDVKYDGSDYYLFDLDGAAEISTLLVKKSEVSEPTIFSLVLICLFSLLLHSQRNRTRSR